MTQQELSKQLQLLITTKGLSQRTISRIIGCSNGTLSDILNNKKPFSQRLINTIFEKIKVYTTNAEDTELVKDVRQYKFINNTLKASHKNAMFTLIVGDTGLGKSMALQQYVKQVKHSYYIKIDRRLTWNQLLTAIASEFGLLDAQGKKREIKRINTYKLMDMITSFVEQQEDIPCLLIDEAEELGYSVLKQLKNLYTATENLMSINICGITSVKNRIAKLAGLNQDWLPIKDESNQYTTFARRVKKFVIPKISYEDLKTFCIKKGLINEEIIKLAYTKWWNYDEANFRISLMKNEQFNISKITKTEFELIQSI